VMSLPRRHAQQPSQVPLTPKLGCVLLKETTKTSGMCCFTGKEGRDRLSTLPLH
jgi:hypothetical protein